MKKITKEQHQELMKEVNMMLADFVRNSGIRLNVDASMPWVSMIDSDDTTIVFLDGHEAQEFLESVYQRLEFCPDLAFEDASYAEAKGWVECVS